MMRTRLARQVSRAPLEEPDSGYAVPSSPQSRVESLNDAPSYGSPPSYNFRDISILAPQPLAARESDDEDSSAGSFFSQAASGAGGLLSDVASGAGNLIKSDVQGAKELVNVGSKVGDSFANPLVNGVKAIDSGVDWVEQNNAAAEKHMVDDTKGIPILGGLAQGAALVEGATDSAIGGTIKGVGDLVSGTASGLAHPLDWAGSMEGVMEHDSTIPGMGTILKAGHGAYDLVENGGGRYGNSVGDVANHVLNPLQAEKDDAKYNAGMAQGILAPEGWEKWKDNPIDAMARAATNVGPMIGGLGEALGEGGPHGAPPEGVIPEDPAPAPPAEEEPGPKPKNPKMSKTGLFDPEEFEDWYENKRKLGIPYDPTPQSPNNARGEWNTPQSPDLPGSKNPVFDQDPGQPAKPSPLATTGPDFKQPVSPMGTTYPQVPGADLPGAHNPVFDEVPNKPVTPPGGGGANPFEDTGVGDGPKTQPGLQPFSPGDTIPDFGPFGENPWELK